MQHGGFRVLVLVFRLQGFGLYHTTAAIAIYKYCQGMMSGSIQTSTRGLPWCMILNPKPQTRGRTDMIMGGVSIVEDLYDREMIFLQFQTRLPHSQTQPHESFFNMIVNQEGFGLRV